MSLADIPVVILAGGQGARFDHETQVRPKPMIEVAEKPILQHIIDGLVHQGCRDFIIATGYLGDQIRDYFARTGRGPFAMNITPGERWWQFGVEYPDLCGIRVVVAETGDDSHTGERLWKVRDLIDGCRFILTYGDGLSDVPMADVVAQHDRTGAGVTVTAVRPPPRFGVLDLPDDGMTLVGSFGQYAVSGWINGGFMVCEPEFIDQYIERFDGEPNFLEAVALRELANDGGLHAYRHDGYWRCMDTRRDRDQIEADVEFFGTLPWRRDLMEREGILGNPACR